MCKRTYEADNDHDISLSSNIKRFYMASVNRRDFLKNSGLATLPMLVANPVLAAMNTGHQQPAPPATQVIKFMGDGEMFEPTEYLNILQQATIVRDSYGAGGSVEALEKKFAGITGKEKAIYMPSGTMANQLAIAVLSGENSKVFVQETSHVYRDEADAAQAVFQKRLMPLAKDEPFFTAQQLQTAVEALPSEEVFKTGVGAVSIENPVRRSSGRMVPLEELRKISTYCRANNIKLHFDGARIYMAAAWSGVSIKEYASLCDTFYISLYKYFGAAGGAVLCGDKAVIDKMPHLIKVHGGSMYGNWTNAAMVLYRLEGFEDRMKSTVQKANELFDALNKISGITIKALPGGTNTYAFALSPKIEITKLRDALNTNYNIRIGRVNEKNEGFLTVNETLLYQDNNYIINAFKKCIG
ncbi:MULTISPECIES: threonine aldolase family protein [Niastella]|uniref:Aminotransferase class I/II-fold pyridoxal phosphate-dependent enzyme n=1 Tax=Niastella soli TaxID=2821487 RepID=A0ABS3YXE6_9BACT|nr:aminotransferase class I/II-fold pyridoxal phosphate-dependent enzyme [Niastella soli]MBO9202423.1 aminotransferase class I/II-fold pyridoxal phosphate-dependent enzyme [Niastella soli]